MLAVYCLESIYRHTSKFYAIHEDFCAVVKIV